MSTRMRGRERPADGVRAGDVARVAAVLGACVDEQEVTVAELAGRWREVHNGCVVARRDDRLEREEVAAVPEERRFERDLQLSLGAARGDQRHEFFEAGTRRL